MSNSLRWNEPASAHLVVTEASGFKERNSEKAHSIGYEEEMSPTVNCDFGGGDCRNGEAIPFTNQGYDKVGGVTDTLRADSNGTLPMVAQPITAIGFDGYNQAVTGGVTASLRSKNADTDHIPIVVTETPIAAILNDMGGDNANRKR